MNKTILVIGATGMLGEPVARRLKEDGFQVRILARNIDKTRKLFDESFDIVAGDATNTNDLEKSLDGCFGVHISLAGETEQLGVENAANMASRKGIQRITYISGVNAFEENMWFPASKQKVLAERAIRESGVPHTIFCPTSSMESISSCIRGARAFIIGRHPRPYHWFAADDLARMVSTSYGAREAINKRLFIYGPEGILFHEALRRYCSVLHPEIKKISTMPYWLANAMARVTGSKDMRFASAVLAFFEKVGEGGDPTEANNILGAPETTIDEWLNQRKVNLGMPSVV